MKLKSKAIIAVAAFSAFLVSSPAGIAQADEMVDEYSVTTDSPGYQSTLTIDFAKPISRQKAKSQVEELAEDSETSSASFTNSPQLDAQGTKLFKLKCSTPFGQIDSKGHMQIQHKCGGKKAPWGFRISSGIQKRITGKVKERGMESTVAGKRQGRQAKHTVDKNYQFHGTFSAKDNQTIQYSDKFTFPVGFNIGTLKIGGKVRFTN